MSRLAWSWTSNLLLKRKYEPIWHSVLSWWKTPFFSKRFVREEKWNCTSHSKKLYSLAVRSKEIYVSPTFCNNISTEKYTGCTFIVCTMPEIKNVRIPSLSKTIHYLYNTCLLKIAEYSISSIENVEYWYKNTRGHSITTWTR